MRQKIQVLALLAALILAPALHSCRLEGEDIGDLYGRWKLVLVHNAHDTIAQPELIFLSFQAEVYQYQPNWRYDWGTFLHEADSLTLHPLSYRSDFGFKDLMHNEAYDGSKPIVFQIERLSDKRMELTRSDTVWVFSKFIE